MSFLYETMSRNSYKQIEHDKTYIVSNKKRVQKLHIQKYVSKKKRKKKKKKKKKSQKDHKLHRARFE